MQRGKEAVTYFHLCLNLHLFISFTLLHPCLSLLFHARLHAPFIHGPKPKLQAFLFWLDRSSMIAASYKLGTEIIWLVLEKECSTAPVAHPSLNKYGMLLILFSLCMEEQLMCQKRKIAKMCRLCSPMKIVILRSICLKIIVRHYRMLLSLKY